MKALNPDDLVIQTYSSKPKGGWSLTPDDGVKITHVPSGLVAFCDSERSQHRNKNIAMQELRNKLEIKA